MPETYVSLRDVRKDTSRSPSRSLSKTRQEHSMNVSSNKENQNSEQITSYLHSECMTEKYHSSHRGQITLRQSEE